VKLIDLAGRRFGRLTVLRQGDSHRTSGGHQVVRWECVCSCGNKTLVRGGFLASGTTSSCGCFRVASRIENGRARRQHGLHGSSIYRSWSGMKARCFNPDDPAYSRYGGRGITVCSFLAQSAAHLASILGPRPQGRETSGRPKWTIDRTNNSMGYWCGACDECQSLNRVLNIRWATSTQQNQNTRAAVHVEINGVTKCASEWARAARISLSAFHRRLRKGVSGHALLLPPTR
jgi:hypothetical protein